MAIILVFTILGFLAGMALVMKKRMISPGKVLTATFLGLLGAGFLKAVQAFLRHQSGRRYY